MILCVLSQLNIISRQWLIIVNHNCFTIKPSVYGLCVPRPPGLYDRNSMHEWFCTEKSLCWVTTCQTWPTTTRFCTRRAVHLDYRTTVEYTGTLLYIGLCKHWTTFCVNFEPQKCKLLVHVCLFALVYLFMFWFENLFVGGRWRGD